MKDLGDFVTTIVGSLIKERGDGRMRKNMTGKVKKTLRRKVEVGRRENAKTRRKTYTSPH